MSLEQITQQMSQRVQPGTLDATVKFDFGDDGKIFVDGPAGSVSNDDKDADCTITISLDNFKSLVAGDLDPTTAFMMGKLKVQGSMGVAMKLQSILG
ncbi:MAG TPA: SCP2 sterol-binding domain-containing protein [Ferrovibrio sp.]|uniref:SCP2 sterol-binding domain-containing protein n=1 Tax=Ferrovibrio sp. TaxID=1917215 RepID=UPI002ED30DC8